MAEADAKKRKRTGATRTKSAIAKPAKKQANESPARTRVAGKRTVVAPDTYNPQKLSEKHAEAKQRQCEVDDIGDLDAEASHQARATSAQGRLRHDEHDVRPRGHADERGQHDEQQDVVGYHLCLVPACGRDVGGQTKVRQALNTRPATASSRASSAGSRCSRSVMIA
jgi:hypothetical protein